MLYARDERDGMKYDYNLHPILGETLTDVEGMTPGSETIVFTCASGRKFRMWHDDDCSSCNLEDVVGDPGDLIGQPLLMAEDVSSNQSLEEISTAEKARHTRLGDEDYGNDSETWTFVKFATVKGYVTLRWFGSSNGYYSESPSFAEITPRTKVKLTLQEIEGLVSRFEKIAAISAYRVVTNTNLKEAKHAVEHFQATGCWPETKLWN